MAAVNINTLATKMNGRGILFEDFFYDAQSHVLPLIFYDHGTLWQPGSDIKPKDIAQSSQLLEDGYTLKWRDIDWRRQGTTVDGAVA